MTRRRSSFALCALISSAALTLACGADGTVTVRPQLVPPQETQDFGEVPVLNQSVKQIELLNVGRGPLRITRVAIVEEGVPFRVIAEPPELIDSGETHAIGVVFVPEAEADYAATLVVESDDPDVPLLELALVGRGSTRAVMGVEPQLLAFDRVAEGQSAVKTFVIESTGTADLIVEELAFTEGTSPAFSFLGSVTTPAVVPHLAENGLPGKITVTVRYTVDPGAPDMAAGAIRIRGTDPDLREVTVGLTGAVNRAPIALIEPLGVGSPGMQVTLDGSLSHDPDLDNPLTYKWVLRSKPLGAGTSIVGPEQPVTQMTLDDRVPGEYVVELQVTDAAGARSLTPARASIVSTPAQKLLVEMFWDNTATDIDLHLLQSPAVVMSDIPGDCHFMNPAPDWGIQGDDTDDPSHLRDALTGYGPEVIGYVNPAADSTFRVIAEFRNEHLSATPASQVTVRIYLYGKVEFEKKFVLNRAGEVWGVADIDWPSGAIRAIQ